MRDDRSGAPQKLLDFDPELDSYYEQCTVENQQESVDSSEKIISLMHNVIKNGKSNELEALSQIQKPKIKQYILSDARYFKETFDFLMRCNVYTLKKYVSNIDLVNINFSVMSSILEISVFSAVVHWPNSLTFRWVKTLTHGSSLDSTSTLIKLF
jgi:hypothetical protein